MKRALLSQPQFMNAGGSGMTSFVCVSWGWSNSFIKSSFMLLQMEINLRVEKGQEDHYDVIPGQL